MSNSYQLAYSVNPNKPFVKTFVLELYKPHPAPSPQQTKRRNQSTSTLRKSQYSESPFRDQNLSHSPSNHTNIHNYNNSNNIYNNSSSHLPQITARSFNLQKFSLFKNDPSDTILTNSIIIPQTIAEEPRLSPRRSNGYLNIPKREQETYAEVSKPKGLSLRNRQTSVPDFTGIHHPLNDQEKLPRLERPSPSNNNSKLMRVKRRNEAKHLSSHNNAVVFERYRVRNDRLDLSDCIKPVVSTELRTMVDDLRKMVDKGYR
jgi:hypothetical protein